MSDCIWDDIINRYSGAGRELVSLTIGKELGKGQYRTVYASVLDPKTVVKYEGGGHDFSNVLEWELWQRFKDTEFAKWLAPCRYISSAGSLLVQDRTEPIPKGMLPKLTPFFLTDFKAANWGLLKGKPVCHDYALIVDTWPKKKQWFKRTKWYA